MKATLLEIKEGDGIKIGDDFFIVSFEKEHHPPAPGFASYEKNVIMLHNIKGGKMKLEHMESMVQLNETTQYISLEYKTG